MSVSLWVSPDCHKFSERLSLYASCNTTQAQISLHCPAHCPGYWEILCPKTAILWWQQERIPRLVETADPPFGGIPANTKRHAKNNDHIVINERWIGQAICQYIHRHPQPRRIFLQGIQMKSLGDLPTSRYQEKGRTRAGQLKAKVKWSDRGIHPSFPPMCHRGTI